MKSFQEAQGGDELARYVKTMYEEFAEQRELDCEEDWDKIDDAFNARDYERHIEGEAGVPSMGQDRSEDKDEHSWRSKDYQRVLANKVISFFVNLVDLYMPNGKVPFALLEDCFDMTFDTLQQEQMQKQLKMQARPAREKMQKKIEQQLMDTKSEREFYKGLFSLAKYGEMTIKAPVLKKIKKTFYKLIDSTPEGVDPQQIPPEQMAQFQRYEREVEEFTVAGMAYKSVWDMFFDREVDDPKDGRGIIERSYVSPVDLRVKQGKPYYFDDAIDEVIENYAKNSDVQDTENIAPSKREIRDRKKTMLHLEAWCRVPVTVAKRFLSEKAGEIEGFTSDDIVDSAALDDDGNELEVVVEVVNDRTIRFSVNHLGERIYHHACLERMSDDSRGHGVGHSLIHDQSSINSVLRQIIDNSRLAGNVMGIIKPGALREPFKPRPGYVPEVSDEVDRAQDAFQQIIVQDVTGPLYRLLQELKLFADENSMVPRSASGEPTVSNKPNTAFEVSVMQENKDKYTAQAARNVDEGVTEPAVAAIYRYNMLDIDPDVQGNFVVNATGFASVQNKLIKQQKLQQTVQLVSGVPQFAQEVNYRNILKELMKMNDIGEEMLLTDEEKAQQVEAKIQEVWQRVAKAMETSPEVLADAVEKKEMILKNNPEMLLEQQQGQEGAGAAAQPQQIA